MRLPLLGSLFLFKEVSQTPVKAEPHKESLRGGLAFDAGFKYFCSPERHKDILSFRIRRNHIKKKIIFGAE